MDSKTSIVTVYTVDYCGYCNRAKELLQSKGVPFNEIKLDRNDDEARKKLVERSGMKTFPQIFHGDRLIGGCSELIDEDRQDGLARLQAR